MSAHFACWRMSKQTMLAACCTFGSGERHARLSMWGSPTSRLVFPKQAVVGGMHLFEHSCQSQDAKSHLGRNYPTVVYIDATSLHVA